MLTLLLPRHDHDFQFAKAGLLEPLMQSHLAEAEPLVGVQARSTVIFLVSYGGDTRPPPHEPSLGGEA